ncbi:MAG: MBL fold metallo-hydrolase [Candidatus Desulfofervidus auxilii]|nr:MBL fold metallo-hydrolase [Candidatus Desulfofervidus auxilii]
MRLTVLVDNNTLIDQYYLGEPAVSYWIEADNYKVLFDVGYSDVFIKNAKALGIDLKQADFLVLSHGHLDHTWGLEHFISLVGKISKGIKLVAHPLTFERKFYKGFGEIGTRKRKEEIAKYFDLSLSKEPIWLTENLCFLGEIPRLNDFEGKMPIGTIIKDGKELPDYVIDDSALVYKSKKGLVIISGCSHSGICNIINYAKKICQETKILDIIGGLHLFDAGEEVLNKTIKYFKSCNIKIIHPCHCTGLRAKIELGKHFQVEEVGSGLILEYE